MIKLFSLKQQKKDGTDTSARTGQKKATAAQLRITKGWMLPSVRSSPHACFQLFRTKRAHS